MTDSSPDLTTITLCPGVEDFVRITGEAYRHHQKDHGTTPPERRQVAEKVRAPWVDGGPMMHAVTEHQVPCDGGQVRIRIYQPRATTTPQPGFIYVHGGGFVMFSLDTHDRLMREYAERANLCVVGVDYALSPESRFPTALNEVVAVARHLHKHGGTYGIDTTRLAIGGDSAGANLSLSAAVVLRDAGEGDILKAMVFNYGAFDTQLDPDDVRQFGGPRFMLTAEEMDGFWAQYLEHPADRNNPLALPMRADLGGLPPTFLCVPQCDVLTTQSLTLARRLATAGVVNRAIVYTGATHSFLEAVSISPVAQQAFADTALWLRNTLT